MKYLWLSLLTACSTLLFALPVHAQLSQAVTVSCMNWTVTDAGAHEVTLEATGLQPNKPFELWREVDNKYECAVDKTGSVVCDGAPTSSPPTSFQLKNTTKDQLITDGGGRTVITQVTSHTVQEVNHFFYAVQGMSSQDVVGNGDNEALKLSTFVPKTSGNNCTSIYWDPEGIVFDAVSLEPIVNSSVTLLDDVKNTVPTSPGIINPFVTKDSGHFSFYVPDGTYFLSAQKSGYRFPLTITEKNELSSRVPNDLYSNLYTGDPIIQINGIVEHRDIPLFPENGQSPASFLPKITDVSIHRISSDRGSNQLITGLVSHPLSRVYVYSGLKQIADTTANKYGQFSVSLNPQLFDQDRPLELIAEKIDFSASKDMNILDKIMAKKQNLRSTPVQIYPIPDFIEGYAMQSSTPAPFAKVRISIPGMNHTLFTVQSDETGFVKIPSILLPPVPFDITTSDKTGKLTTTLTTATFIQQNSDYLKSNKVNVFDKSTSSESKPDSPVVSSNLKTSPPFAKPQYQETPNAKAADQNGTRSLLITLVLLLGVASILGAITYIKKRSTQSEPLDTV
ncbi:MAG: carboxypeptidase-like regulatory domain-containing protein [Candidatus Roizmanbacteria bacterium]|nr:carboxypeptidase-like regulatory domain-containing protein [Candidatus Roizmanbacteria bacterium]